uniref:Protein RecA n=1 Tax=Anthurium amnicola TaxID=1678845 RepID=A0A1D1XJ83_9ARAE
MLNLFNNCRHPLFRFQFNSLFPSRPLILPLLLHFHSNDHGSSSDLFSNVETHSGDSSVQGLVKERGCPTSQKRGSDIVDLVVNNSAEDNFGASKLSPDDTNILAKILEENAAMKRELEVRV